jgi:hypothetical protein
VRKEGSMRHQLLLASVLGVGLLASTAFSTEAPRGFSEPAATAIASQAADVQDDYAGYYVYRVDVWVYGAGWVTDSYHLCYVNACERAVYTSRGQE